MDIQIYSTLTEFAARTAELQRHLPAGIESGIKQATRHVFNIAAKRLGRIYSAPIPTQAQVKAYRGGGKKIARKLIGSGGGAPAWRRSGDLQRGLTATYPSRDAGLIDIRGNAAVYAARRAGLGVDWQPKAPALGIIRKNPFMTEAMQITEPQLPVIFEKAMRKELGI